MSEQEKKIKTPVTRREFLKQAGIMAGGVGTVVLLSSCSPTVTSTVAGTTVTKTSTVTATPPAVTTTVTSAAVTKTSTVTANPAAVTSTITETVTKTATSTVTPPAVTSTVTVDKGSPTMTLTVNGQPIILTVNNADVSLVAHRAYDVYGYDTLLYTLRETLELTGTKSVCDRGACGCCTVLMDGEPILACMVLTTECNGKGITTIEGLEDPVTSKVNKLQQAFIDNTAFQCGMCTPGIIMCAQALLNKNSNPTKDDICDALANHFCRCVSHYQVIEAVLAAATGKSTIPTFPTTPTPTASIEVIPTPNVSLAPGSTRQFKAIMRTLDYSTPDITSTATWTSTNPVVATISSAGLATGVAVGNTTITASKDGITSSLVSLTVEVK